MSGFIIVDALACGRIQFRIRDSSDVEVVVRGIETIEAIGPYGWDIYLGHSGQFKITDYHFCDDYVVQTDNGVVTIEDDIITYTPESVGMSGFSVNGNFYSVNVFENQPVKPSVVYPTATAKLPDPVFTILSSSYDSASAILVHQSTTWQVSTDPDFTNIVMEINSETELESISSQGLEYGRSYYVRIRHIATDTAA